MVSDLVRILTPHLFADKRAVNDAVYGTVSVMAVIAGAAHKETSAGRVLVFAAVSSLVIWAVHVYADTVAHLGPHAMDWREALRQGVANDIGVLWGALIPLLVLTAGAVGLVEDRRAILWAMLSGVALLILLPVVWLRRIEAPWSRCVAASAVAGTFGLILTGLKVAVH